MAAVTAGTVVGVPGVAGASPSGGSTATWTTGEQYGIGTVQDHGSSDPSRVWFTLTEGALTGGRFPRIDLMNLRSLDVVVADAADDSTYVKRGLNVDRTDDDGATVERRTELADSRALVFEQTVTETADGRDWTVTVEYVTHPDHDAILADVAFEASDDHSYDVYAVVDPTLSNSGRADVANVTEVERTPPFPAGSGGRGGGNGNGDGRDNGNGNGNGGNGRGPPSRTVTVLTGADTGANDGQAVFLDEDGEPYNVALAVSTRTGFDWGTADVVGGDSLSPLLVEGDAATRYDEADGNVALVGRLGADTQSLSDTISLGFAEEGDQQAATDVAEAGLRPPFEAVRGRYGASWRQYLAGLDTPRVVRRDADLREQYRAAIMALKAADSKQFPGAGLASLSVPWGDAVTADDPADYGYNFTWSRDLYQAYTALSAVGDVESAQEAVEYIYEFQQDEQGFIPQNTYVDGRTRWGGEQMDNISFPQVMAYQQWARHGIGLDEAAYDYENVRRSADYVAVQGPFTDQERWEEEAGYSPSTTAAEIAGLVCAAEFAADEGERADALAYLGQADFWQRNTENWMATDEGTAEHDNTPYYFRINDDRDPDDGASLSINNGGPTLDERNVIDAGFLELVRLGVKPHDDEVIENSLSEVDDTIRVDTPHGPAFYRYNGDGYGEQGGSDNPAGAPWSLDNTGRGRLWPIFTGERGEYELLAGTDSGPTAPGNLLSTMAGFANSGRMIPEQVWDREGATAYDWEFGEGTGSATPLSWSMAQFVRLAQSIEAGEPVETPAVVRDRYADGARSGGPDLSVEFPPSVVTSRTVTVSGTTSGTEVAVKTPAETVSTGVSDDSFSIEVAVGGGESPIVVVASDGADDVREAATTVARDTVSFLDVGEEVATWSDPAGDDHGPGSYTYPTDDVFVDGAFDVTSFEIYETDDRVQFLTRLRGDLTNPFGGNGFSLQFLQVYVRDPNAGGGSTQAREGVNATFEAPYQYRVLADGFSQPRIEAGDGSEVSRDVSVTAVGAIDALLVELPKSAIGGIAGKELAPLMLGQDGFNPGSVRPVQASAGGFVFGGGRDDDADPNVIDVVTPDGVSNADALAYTASDPASIPFRSV